MSQSVSVGQPITSRSGEGYGPGRATSHRLRSVLRVPREEDVALSQFMDGGEWEHGYRIRAPKVGATEIWRSICEGAADPAVLTLTPEGPYDWVDAYVGRQTSQVCADNTFVSGPEGFSRLVDGLAFRLDQNLDADIEQQFWTLMPSSPVNLGAANLLNDGNPTDVGTARRIVSRVLACSPDRLMIVGTGDAIDTLGRDDWIIQSSTGQLATKIGGHLAAAACVPADLGPNGAGLIPNSQDVSAVDYANGRSWVSISAQATLRVGGQWPATPQAAQETLVRDVNTTTVTGNRSFGIGAHDRSSFLLLLETGVPSVV